MILKRLWAAAAVGLATSAAAWGGMAQPMTCLGGKNAPLRIETGTMRGPEPGSWLYLGAGLVLVAVGFHLRPGPSSRPTDDV